MNKAKQAQPRAMDDADEWQNRLSIVVPAHNEQDGIAAVIKDLKSTMPNAEIIVVDDGSSDETGARASAIKGITVIQHGINLGYGAAIKTGTRHATRDYLAWFDGDNQHRAQDLADMAQRIDREYLCAVIGRRNNVPQSPLRSIGKGLMRLLALALQGAIIRDLNCGLRVFRRDLLTRYLAFLPDGFSASTTTTLLMTHRKYPLAFHDITLNERIGTSKVTLVDGFSALSLIVRIVLVVAPLRIFAVSGLSLIAIGLIYGLIVAFSERAGFPTAAVVVLMFGSMFCVLGFIADQLSQLRLSLLSPGIGSKIIHDARDKKAAQTKQ